MMTLGEISEAMEGLKDWSLETNSIVKVFSFPNFKASVDFVNKVAEVAEKVGHHPDVLINYDKVRLSLTTHSEKSLTKKDFELAKEIDGMNDVD